MSWNHIVHLIIPADHLDIANRIGRSLDPDTGGDQTFSIPLPQDSPTHYGASTAAAESFVQTIQAVQAGHIPLLTLVQQDYSARWTDLNVPTEAECQTFMNTCIIRIDIPWMDVMMELGFVVDTLEA
jgi:hypothetical protein